MAALQQAEFDFDSCRVDQAIRGDDYDPVRDLERLKTQLARIFSLCRDGEWRTVDKISRELRAAHGVFFPENSVQAQLRNLRKLGIRVERRRIGAGLSQYRVMVKKGVRCA